MAADYLGTLALGIGSAVTIFLGVLLAAATLALQETEEAAARARAAAFDLGQRGAELLTGLTAGQLRLLPGSMLDGTGNLASAWTKLELDPRRVSFAVYEAKVVAMNTEWARSDKEFQRATGALIEDVRTLGATPAKLDEVQARRDIGRELTLLRGPSTPQLAR